MATRKVASEGEFSNNTQKENRVEERKANQDAVQHVNEEANQEAVQTVNEQEN